MAWHPADADTSAFVAQCPEEIHDLANERVVNRHFQNGETTCCQLSKRLPNNSTIFAADPPKCCYFVVVGGLVCMDDPRGYASWSSWLLEGSTMLDRLFERGQTKCNTPLGTPMIPEAMSSGTSVPSGPTMMNRLWLRVHINQGTTDAGNTVKHWLDADFVDLLFGRSPDQWYSNPTKRNALAVTSALWYGIPSLLCW